MTLLSMWKRRASGERALFRPYFLLLLLLLFLGLYSRTAEARITAAMSTKVFLALQSVQKKIDREAYAEAGRKLEKLRKSPGLSPYERAQVWNLSAYIHYLKNDYRKAAQAYEQVLKQSGLPPALMQSSLKTLSQLSLINENYTRAISAAKALLKLLKQPDANTLMLIGQAHYSLQQYPKARTLVRQAITLVRQQRKIPQESWLQLLNGIYHHLNDYRAMVKVLKELIRYYPDSQYLRTLAGVYSELGHSKKQLAVTEALYENGKLNRPDELKNLASLYLTHQLPYKAAKLLQTSLNKQRLKAEPGILKLLAQAWTLAGDDAKAIAPLQQAAALSQDGELYRRLGHAYFNLGNWQQAERVLETALQQKQLKDRSGTRVLLGMSRYRLKHYEAAKKTFKRAAKDPRMQKLAKQWIAFIDREEAQRRELEAYVQ